MSRSLSRTASEGLAMSYRSVSDPRPPRAVRTGQGAPVTCGACGCRLEAVGRPGAEAWFHFGRLGGRDARGCRVVCLEAAHDAGGAAVAA